MYMRLGMNDNVYSVKYMHHYKKSEMVAIKVDGIDVYKHFHMDESEFRKLAIKITIKGYAFIDKTESYGRYEDEIPWYKVTDFENWER